MHRITLNLHKIVYLQMVPLSSSSNIMRRKFRGITGRTIDKQSSDLNTVEG